MFKSCARSISHCSVHTMKSPIFNTNPNNIKLQMLQEGLKCKQLEEKNAIYIKQNEVKINNHKVGNSLNEDFIRDN